MNDPRRVNTFATHAPFANKLACMQELVIAATNNDMIRLQDGICRLMNTACSTWPDADPIHMAVNLVEVNACLRQQLCELEARAQIAATGTPKFTGGRPASGGVSSR